MVLLLGVRSHDKKGSARVVQLVQSRVSARAELAVLYCNITRQRIVSQIRENMYTFISHVLM